MSKNIRAEDDYRKRLRIVARIMDHEAELKSVGYGDEYLHLLKQDTQKAMQYHKKIMQIFNSHNQKTIGYEQELLNIFDKYDKLLKKCKTDAERRAIGTLGILAVNKLMDDGEVGFGGALKINNKTVISNDAADTIIDNKIKENKNGK